jgi:hypothetical protein
VFENKVLGRMFWPKGEEVTMLQNKEAHNLYLSPNIIGMIKSGRIKWTGHVAYVGENGRKNVQETEQHEYT